jgi:hypothetical protein
MSRVDATPHSSCTFPPDPVRLQARADRAEQEAKARKNKDSQPCRTRKPYFDPTGLCIGILWLVT